MPVPQRASREKPTRSSGLWCMVLFCCDDAIYVRVCACVCVHMVWHIHMSCACVVPRVSIVIMCLVWTREIVLLMCRCAKVICA